MATFMFRGKPYCPDKIAAQINAGGFAVPEEYIDAHDLKVAQDFARAAVKQNCGNCIIFRGPKEELAGTFMYDLPMNRDFGGSCHAIYEAGTAGRAPHSGCYQVLRCLSGQFGQKNSMKFHCDTYALAALIPIIIPSEGAQGSPAVAECKTTQKILCLELDGRGHSCQPDETECIEEHV